MRPSRARRAAVIVAAVAASAALAVGIAAWQNPQVRVPRPFRASVDLVTVDVAVRGGNRPVAGLAAADFVLTDNGVPQTVDVVEPGTLPIDVTILVDTSGSMENQMAGVLTQARAAAGLLRPDDQMRLVTFAWNVSAGRFQAGEGAAAIEELAARGPTALMDGLAVALMRPRIEDRRHLVIAYTDGEDNSSSLTDDDLALVSRRTDSVLQVLKVQPTEPLATVRVTSDLERLDTRRRWMPPVIASGFWSLGEIARNTGGDIEQVVARTDSTSTIANVIARFRESYVLRYRVTGVPLPGWHRIEVRVTGRDGLSVRARRGYFVNEG